MSGSRTRLEEKIHGVCLLSFDNGGPGTYSQLLILKEYMGRLASDLQVVEDEVYPADYFDLMGGAGFGGMVAFMLGHLRMNVDQVMDALLVLMAHISFDDSEDSIDRESNSTTLRNLLEDTLSARGIAADTKMDDPNSSSKQCKVALYAAASANLTHPYIFRTYPSRGSTPNPTIIEALCATMAIQSHFLPAKVRLPRVRELFVGGALGANNPTRLLLEEASKVFGTNRRVAQIISLGCGLPRVLSLDSSNRQGLGRLLQEITTDCEMVANELSTRLLDVNAYLRLNVNRGMESIKMKEWAALGAVETHTAAYLATPYVSNLIDNSVQGLQERVGSVTFGRLIQFKKIKVMVKTAPPVSPHFVLREKPWKAMVDHLVKSASTRQKIFPITGMGGCGKTQLVSYFLQEYLTLYAQSVYIDASSSSSIKADLQAWAQALGDGHECDVWEDALRKLNGVPPDERWILILDNVEDPDLDINSFLPKDPNVTILITSQMRNFGNLSTTIHLELGEMTTDEALSVMVRAARRQLPLPDEEMKNAQILLEQLGRLAVALVQAGTYCRQLSKSGDISSPYTFTQYMHLFISRRADLMKKAEPAPLDKYQRGVYTTLDLTYKRLPQKSRDVLHTLSFFHYTDIPLAAFSKAAENAFEDLEDYHPRGDTRRAIISKLSDLLWKGAGWDEWHLQEIIRDLSAFSLVTTSSTENSLFIHLHPLVQAWSRDTSSTSSQSYRSMAIQILTACGSKDIGLNRLLLPHILDIIRQIELHDMQINDLMSFGEVIRQQGHYHRAGQLLQKALEHMKRSNQATPLNTLQVTSLLADSYWSDRRWAESERLCAEVHKQRKQLLGAAHPDTIKSAASLARTYRSLERWTESEGLDVEVLRQRRQILGLKHPDTIEAAASLAMTYRGQGRQTECEELEMEVLEQRRQILGTDHPDTIRAAANLALTYHSQKRWNESEKLFTEVLRQRRRILGVDHPITIRAAASLASTYYSQGRLVESEKLFLEVLEQQKRVLGVEHPDTIRATANLAITYHSQGCLTECEKLLEEVLERRKRSLGMDHPDTIRAAENLAWIYHSQERWNECENLELELFERRRRVLGMEHPDTIKVATSLSWTYHSQQRWSESSALEVEILDQRRKTLGTEHPDTIRATTNLAFTHALEGLWIEAFMLLVPAVQAGVKVQGLQHPHTQFAIEILAFVLKKMGMHREAQETKAFLVLDASHLHESSPRRVRSPLLALGQALRRIFGHSRADDRSITEQVHDAA